jgi:RNA polymerase sigma factor (sigma-70 family)
MEAVGLRLRGFALNHDGRQTSDNATMTGQISRLAGNEKLLIPRITLVSSQTPASDEIPAVPATQATWFTTEVHAHDSSLKNYLRRSFPAVRDVDDVVQESYLRVWKRQAMRPIADVTGAVKASVKGFLFQVARRLALDSLRRERTSPFAIQETDTTAGAIDERASAAHDVAGTNQEFALLLEAIDALPGRCREVVVARMLHGMSPGEAAGKLGISEETVHVQTRRGLQRVQVFLRRRGVIRGHES